MSDQALDKFEIAEHFGPYRFIGRAVYASPFGREAGKIYGGVWENSDWIFEELDRLTEYATDEVNHFAFMTWEKYDDKTQLMGYTVGRFMKAGTPVPEGMDYFDVAVSVVGKGWAGGEFRDVAHGMELSNATDSLVKKAIEQQTVYRDASWKWYAEAYPEGFPNKAVPGEDGRYYFGTYVNCLPKQMKKWYQRKRG